MNTYLTVIKYLIINVIALGEKKMQLGACSSYMDKSNGTPTITPKGTLTDRHRKSFVPVAIRLQLFLAL